MRHTFQDYDSWKTNSGYEDEVRYDEPEAARDPWLLNGVLPQAFEAKWFPSASPIEDDEVA